MKLASAWLLTAAGATELALAGPARMHVPSPQLRAELMQAADAVPAADPAPAPPQPPVDRAREYGAMRGMNGPHGPAGDDHEVVDVRVGRSGHVLVLA